MVRSGGDERTKPPHRRVPLHSPVTCERRRYASEVSLAPHEITLGGRQVTVSFSTGDDHEPLRVLVLKLEDRQRSYWFQQLFQLSPFEILTSPMRGTGAFTGVATLHAPADAGAGGDVSVGCRAE